MVAERAIPKIQYSFVPVRACDMCGGARFATLGERLGGRTGVNPRRSAGLATGVKRCQDCGLVFSDPRPVPADLSDHYGVEAVDYFSADQLNAPPGFFQTEITAARRLLGGGRLKALDVGAGSGNVMLALEAAGIEAWGLEPGAHFRDFAIRRGIAPERIVQAPIETAELPPASFDFVSLNAVLEHLQDPAAAIERAMTWLRPGGILYVEVPSADWLMAKIANSFFHLRGANYVTNISPLHPPYHLYEFTPRSFETHAKRAGYEVAETHHYVCAVLGAPRILHPALTALMKRTRSGMEFTVWLRKNGEAQPHDCRAETSGTAANPMQNRTE
ncbi:MAG TPA: class I SAM-dependent methyltransferase [Caulobacteraceae bacterium]|jgi:SAM-dependent methyltransferase|nr:class I SAM-dependent methyltransferase [Caulobacteraceae bacterium]